MPNKNEEKELSWEDHLAETIKAFRKEMKDWHGDKMPSEFHTHRRNAQREMLLAWRSLIDARIEKLEKAEKEKSAPKAKKIQVE